MKRDERRIHGVHYTTEPFVLRVLSPLFLDDLHALLRNASAPKDLLAFLRHIHSLTFLDPACGTGNFLVVAYRSLKHLEIEARRRLHALCADFVQTSPRVELQQFHGIDRDAEAAAIARETLQRVALDFDASGLSDQTRPQIIVANALQLAWNEVLPAERASFVFGNPPFVGMAWMTSEQREDQRRAFAFADARGLRLGRLDYAASFFAKSIEYGMGHDVHFGYLVTNSICQGEHARSLGPLFEKYGFYIDFAWRPFPWFTNESRKARVHVVALGFSQKERRPKRLFEHDRQSENVVETHVENINFYLTSGPDVFPAKRATPLQKGYPLATKGNQPTDGGFLIVEKEDLAAFLSDPIAGKYVRRYVQAKELLSHEKRYCLWLVEANPDELATSPILKERLTRIQSIREASRTPRVRKYAATPWLFTQIRQPTARYLALPEVSSEKRPWIPAAFLESDVIAGNKLIMLPNADAWVFGLLQSSMFMAWLRVMSGRLKSDISISPDLSYNTFPFPEVTPDARENVIATAEKVLHVRTRFVGKSLGELYDPGKMPRSLLEAHEALDREVDALFGGVKRNEQRIEILLGKYQEFRSARI